MMRMPMPPKSARRAGGLSRRSSQRPRCPRRRFEGGPRRDDPRPRRPGRLGAPGGDDQQEREQEGAGQRPGQPRGHEGAEGPAAARARDEHGTRDPDDLASLLRPAIEADLARLAADWPKDLPTGVIHADYFPDNVFFQAGRFAGAIDFYVKAFGMKKRGT